MIEGVTERTRPRVLVVDDDAGIRQLITLAVNSSGYEAVASDGHGVDALEDDFAAVLLDVRLGDRSATDVLREAPWLTDRPLIVMTAGAEDREALMALPEHTLLRKPFDLKALDEAIEVATSATR
jgi:DNA-binding response OmpR family regulator